MEYIHGGDIYRNIIEHDFSTNINPLGMPDKAIEAAKYGVELSGRYPDWKGEKLLEAIGEAEGVRQNYIIAGNGAAELIYAFAYGNKPKSAMLLNPTFQEYEASLAQIRCKPVYYPLSEKNGFEIEDDIFSRIPSFLDALYICYPNNPTGGLIGLEKMEKILSICKKNGTIVVIDECFLDFLFNGEALSTKQFLCQYNNLLILKAFTKIYAMAGLRLGYALSSNLELLNQMKKALQPWNTSIPAQMAGIAALKETDYVLRTKHLINDEKKYLVGAMSAGLADRIYESYANFIFFRAENNLYDEFFKRGILIRDCSNFGLSKGFYRIGIKTRQQNELLIKSWKEIKMNI